MCLFSQGFQQVINPGAVHFNDAGQWFIIVIGKVEELGVCRGPFAVVINFKTDYASGVAGVQFRATALPFKEAHNRVFTAAGHFYRLLGKKHFVSFPLVGGLVEQEHKKSAGDKKGSKPCVDEIQADAGGQNYGRYCEVLDRMDLFEFDFHLIVKVC